LTIAPDDVGQMSKSSDSPLVQPFLC